MVQNHRQKYHNNRIFQQASYKTDSDRGKGVAHGMIRSGITTLKKQATLSIPLKKDSNYRGEKRFIFNFLKKRNQRDKKLSSFPDLQSKKILHIHPILELNLFRFN